MNIRRNRLVALACVALFSMASPRQSLAQRASSLFLEFNVGLSAGDASVPNGPSRGISGDVLLGYNPGRRQSRGFVTAVSGSGQTPMASIACDVVPGGTCPIDFPGFWIVAAQIGWESTNGRARILLGPALAISEFESTVAAQVRMELSKPIAGRLSLVGSARFAHVPQLDEKSFNLGAVGIGLRIR